ncbi:MAG: glycosyltransferase family 39 protein [Methanospirillum sp.]
MTPCNPLIFRFKDPFNRFVARSDLFFLAVITIFFVRCLISAHDWEMGDLFAHLWGSRGLLQGQTLYIDTKFEYPPLHAYFQALWLWLLGDNPFAAKVPSLIGDVGTATLLYLIGARKDEMLGRWLAICYLMFPISIISSNMMGHFDSLALALMLLGILFAFRERWAASAASIGIGVMYKFLPILAAVPILFYLYRKRHFRFATFYLLVVGVICAVILTPFLLDDPVKVLALIFNTGSKLPDTYSLFYACYIPDRILPFLVQIGATATIFYIVIRKRIFELFSFEAITLFVALFMMLNKNLYPHYFIWIFPFFAYWFIRHGYSVWLIVLLLFDTVLLCLKWFQPSHFASWTPWPTIVFQVVNWTAIGLALFLQKRANERMISVIVFP